MELPRELKRLIEKYKSLYNISGNDDEILKKVIPKLEDEDIIKIYDELCKEESLHSIQNGYRPNFEKYREDLLVYLDDSMVKSEIIKREQKQSSKADLQQRNYTYITEFTTNLDSNPDKLKIIKTFYKKLKTLESERDLLNVTESINNLELSIHIYECILHIREKMSIDLVLYRGFKGTKKYKLLNYVDFKKIRDRKNQKEEYQRLLQVLYLNQINANINRLNAQLQALKQQEKANTSSEEEFR